CKMFMCESANNAHNNKNSYEHKYNNLEEYINIYDTIFNNIDNNTDITIDPNKNKLEVIQKSEKVYCKVLNADMCNKNFQYVEGINNLSEKFNPTECCDNGGLY